MVYTIKKQYQQFKYSDPLWRAGPCLPFVTAFMTDGCVRYIYLFNIYNCSWKCMNVIKYLCFDLKLQLFFFKRWHPPSQPPPPPILPDQKTYRLRFRHCSRISSARKNNSLYSISFGLHLYFYLFY